MGELIEMPLRNTEPNMEPSRERERPGNTEQTAAPESNIDFSVWKRAPRERTPAYFPIYSTVSKAIQSALRTWTREWFNANQEILMRPYTAYPVLVYQCTHPFSGKPTNIFTYDIQQTDTLDRAFRSAASRLSRELKLLDTKNLEWFTRQHYFAYRGKEVIKHVQKNRRAIYKMLNTETVLMDSILKFALIDVPKLGLDGALVNLRRAFQTQLHRFSDLFDLSPRTEELLRIATEALVSKLPAENVIEMPLAA